jgi:hypothetical protein
MARRPPPDGAAIAPRGGSFGDGKEVSARAVSGFRFFQRFHSVPVRTADGTKAYPGSGQAPAALAAKRRALLAATARQTGDDTLQLVFPSLELFHVDHGGTAPGPKSAAERAANLARMNDAALAVWRKGHAPIGVKT